MIMLSRSRLLKSLILLCFLAGGTISLRELQADVSVAEAKQAMRKATDFFTTQVAAEGGYLWRYSRDLKYREGEELATDSMIWLQPPGTPTVGEAYLSAYQKTGEPYLLKAAQATANALINSQLKSGGWADSVDFSKRSQSQFRVDGGGPSARNITTFDDNKSQSAVHFLIQLDQELKFKDQRLHEATLYALDSFIKAQFPNGGWPQRYDHFPDPKEYPVLKANYPDHWSRTFPKQKYTGYYTFNDNTIQDLVNVMFLAYHVYQDPRYRDSALKAGDFIILAQMPEPQPAWAQQYNLKMQPAWARKFEPPAVTGGESQGVIKTLLQIYIYTGEKKYLAPIPKALAYLKKSELPGGKLARFYELKTNRPLYFTKKYELTYKDDDMPTHYGFIVSSKVDSLQRQYEKLLKASPEKLASMQFPQRRVRLTPALKARAQSVVNALNEQGAWLTQGEIRSANLKNVPVIETRVFAKNLETLADFVAASQSD
ncbi:Pectic acid lyase [Gimesia panareensis]|uniref:Pectic acid lyase n=1 Tax=Gimesia panareensis TaxID=2527978 RepID=A0A517QBY8_9PLAN|nr:pectate lyase [Gimesia panareensis]QDT29144.1 Pectic acid lyase [Gimesia panareensis]